MDNQANESSNRKYASIFPNAVDVTQLMYQMRLA